MGIATSWQCLTSPPKILPTQREDRSWSGRGSYNCSVRDNRFPYREIFSFSIWQFSSLKKRLHRMASTSNLDCTILYLLFMSKKDCSPRCRTQAISSGLFWTGASSKCNYYFHAFTVYQMYVLYTLTEETNIYNNSHWMVLKSLLEKKILFQFISGKKSGIIFISTNI